MKVKELVTKLQEYNPEAEVDVIAYNKSFEFSLCHGGADGAGPKDAIDVSFYVDELCKSEQEKPLSVFL